MRETEVQFVLKKGASILRNPEERRLRALKMIDFRVRTGATHKEVAKEFGVSEKTVFRTLSWAKRAGLMVEAEDRILQELVPKAIDAVAAALEEGDAQVALEIFKGTIPGFSKNKTGAKPVTTEGANELEAYIAQLRGELAGAVEGEVLRPAKTLPAAAQGADEEGLPAPDRGDADGNGAPARTAARMGEGIE